MVPFPRIDNYLLPYPKPRNYRKQLHHWLHLHPWVTLGKGSYFPIESKILGTVTDIKDGTVTNGPLTIKGSAYVSIGKYGGIAENLYIISSNHSLDCADVGGMFSAQTDVTKGPIYIGHNVWIGDNVTVLSGTIVGDGAVIGAGSVVTHDIPPFAVAAGVPARVIKYRFSKGTIDKLLRVAWWHWDFQIIKKNIKFFETPITDSNIDELMQNIDVKHDSEIISLQMKNIATMSWLLDGWGPRENTFRWVQNKEAGFVFKIKRTDVYHHLKINGYSFYKPQKIEIRINGKKVGTFFMYPDINEYDIPVKNFSPGINTIRFVFEKGHIPYQVQNSKDKRVLYCQFESIRLAE